MEIDDVLGYINNLVEHDELKTIIVANEEVIENMYFSRNIEDKLLLASNTNINMPVDIKTDNNQRTYTVNELYDRAKQIFCETQKYKIIKEKLVGMTIEYIPEISNVIDNLLQCKNYCTATKAEIKKNIDFISFELEKFKHLNIRTLQSAFDSYNNIIMAFGNRIKEGYPEIYTEMFQYCLIATISKKTQNEVYDWEKSDKEIGQINISKNSMNLSDFIKGFKFIDLYLEQGYFNIDAALDLVTSEIEANIKMQALYESPYYKLSNEYYYQDDRYVNELINNLNEDFQNNRDNYLFAIYPRLLLLYTVLEDLGFCNANTANLLGIMVDRIENAKYKINKYEFDSEYYYRSHADRKNLKMKEMLSKLEDACISNNKKNYAKDVTAIFQKKNWVEKLEEHFTEKDKTYEFGGSSIFDMPIADLIDKVKNLDSKDIIELGSVIRNLYRFANSAELYPHDYASIIELKDNIITYIDTIKSDHKIKAMNLRNLVNLLENISKLYPEAKGDII